MQELIVEIVDKFGYIGIFLLIAIETVFPPIPSEIILTFGGFMTTYTQMNVWVVILSATVGSVAGAVLWYGIGRILNADRLKRLFNSKLGKVLRLKKSDVTKAGKWFEKQGSKAVFFGRFVPIIRSLVSLPAGMAKMKMLSFLGFTVAGTLIWNTVLIFLGRIAGSAWEKISEYLDIYTMVFIVILAVIFVIAAIIFIKKRFLKSSEESEEDKE